MRATIFVLMLAGACTGATAGEAAPTPARLVPPPAPPIAAKTTVTVERSDLDGALTKTCSTGGCAFACTGGNNCTSTCSGGRCDQICEHGGTCNFTCSGGGCTQTCRAGSSCTLTCSGGGCSRDCGAARTCSATCSGDGCGG